jgi:predicted Ser/Thr protein kinase
MIYRALLLCVAGIAALSSHVDSFSNDPARGSRSGLLKGAASSSSRAVPTSHTTLHAVKKGTTKKKTSTKKSVEEATAPVAVDDEVVKFKKADFVSAVAEKTGMTKVQSDLALTAVLDVLATVRELSC